MIGLTPSTFGVAIRIAFSTKRAGKAILWSQSKRLTPGTLVALSPTCDNFSTKVLLATVAARPLVALEINPPELDLCFARAEEVELDPSIEWVMIEARASFFEAARHVLLALQKMIQEP